LDTIEQAEKKLKRQHEILKDYCMLIWHYDRDLPKVEDAMSVMYSAMLGSMAESLRTILYISELGFYRDTLALSRTILEISINIAYFSIQGEEAVSKTIKHIKQKSYRDVMRSCKIGDFEFHSAVGRKVDVWMSDELKEAIDNFTSKKGKEIRSWTGDSQDSVPKKIKLIASKYGKDIGSLYDFYTHNIYRHSSEILHGTIFGAFYSGGITLPRSEWPMTDEEIKIYQLNELSFLLTNLSMMCNSTVYILHDDFPRPEIIEDAKELAAKLTKE
jgi:hypothetical protein